MTNYIIVHTRYINKYSIVNHNYRLQGYINFNQKGRYPVLTAKYIRKTVFLALSFTLITTQAIAADRATDDYYEANALFNKKLFKLATSQYKSFIARYPSHDKYLSAKLGLALSYYELGDLSSAKPILAELSNNRKAPRQEQVHNLLGNTYLQVGDPVRAEAAFRWSVNRGKEKFFVELPGVNDQVSEDAGVSVGTLQNKEALEISMAGLMEALYQQNKWTEVILTGDDLLKKIPEGKYSTRARFLSALANYESKKYKSAARIITNIIKVSDNRSPYREHAFFLLGDCNFKLNNLEEAAKYNQIVAKEMKGRFTSDALFKLGYIRFLQKRYTDSIKEFTDLRAIFRKSKHAAEAGMYLGRSHLKLKHYEKSQEVFGALTNVSPVKAEATQWLAKTFLQQKKYNEAIDILTPALTTFSTDELLPNLLFDLGNSYLSITNYKEASVSFARVAQEFPSINIAPDALRLEAFCLNRSLQYEESLRRTINFLQKYPLNASNKDVAFLKAENLFFMNRVSEALRAYEQFIPFDGKGKYTDQARFRIIQGLCNQSKWEQSLEEISILIKQDIDDKFYIQLGYLAGLSNYHLSKWKDSITYLEGFTSKYPAELNADAAMLKCSLAYIKVNNAGKAIITLSELISEYPKSEHIAHAHTELGAQLYKEKQYTEARKNLKKVTTLHPDSPYTPQAEYYLAWLSLAEKKNQDALDHFSNVYRKSPDHFLAADSLYQQAFQFMKQKAYAQSQKKFRMFIETYVGDSHSEAALFYYSVSIARQNKYEEAIEILKKFIGDYPKSEFVERALYETAWCARELGQDAVAKKEYQTLLKKFPNGELSDVGTFELAEVEFESRNFDKAITLLDGLLARGVENQLKEKIYYRQAWSLLGRDQKETSLETFEKLLLNFPETTYSPEASYQAGELRLEQKDFEQAYLHFSKAANFDKRNPVREQALLRVGETQTLTNRWKEAEKSFDQFIKEFPNSKFQRRSYMWLGWSQENQKKYRYALKNYHTVIESRERDKIAARSQFQIGECHFALREYDEAIKAMVKVEINYNYPEWTAKAILEMGQALDQKGERKRANEQFRKVVEQFPGTSESVVAKELLVERKAYISN